MTPYRQKDNSTAGLVSKKDVLKLSPIVANHQIMMMMSPVVIIYVSLQLLPISLHHLPQAWITRDNIL